MSSWLVPGKVLINNKMALGTGTKKLGYKSALRTAVAALWKMLEGRKGGIQCPSEVTGALGQRPESLTGPHNQMASASLRHPPSPYACTPGARPLWGCPSLCVCLPFYLSIYHVSLTLAGAEHQTRGHQHMNHAHHGEVAETGLIHSIKWPFKKIGILICWVGMCAHAYECPARP